MQGNHREKNIKTVNKTLQFAATCKRSISSDLLMLKTRLLPRSRGCLVGSIALLSRAEAQSSYMSLAAASFSVIRSCI